MISESEHMAASKTNRDMRAMLALVATCEGQQVVDGRMRGHDGVGWSG
jgi:hypothetical protein